MISTIIRWLQLAVTAALASVWSQIVATVILGLFIVLIAWIVLRGAAVARRRIKLTLDRPIGALWETIGRCGSPPQDPSRVFALIAIILALLPWVLIPIGIGISWLIRQLGSDDPASEQALRLSLSVLAPSAPLDRLRAFARSGRRIEL